MAVTRQQPAYVAHPFTCGIPYQMAMICGGGAPVEPVEPRPSVVLEYRPSSRKRKYFELSNDGE